MHYIDMDLGFDVREMFHLHVLRQLTGRLASRPYAVKGGICLRFFHRSPRLSEDMDIDIAPGMPLKTLQNNVNAVLGGQALAASLRACGVTAVEFTRPKKTDTTQRWKVGLAVAGGARLSTSLEFSRRSAAIHAERGSLNPELLQKAFVAPFAVAYYGASEMIRQKIRALASPSRTAARDLFDLDHLFTHAQLGPETHWQEVDRPVLEKALEKVSRFEYADFRDQVIPYLPGDLQALYKDASAFKSLREVVEKHLRGLIQ